MRIDSPGHHVPSRPANGGGGPNGQGAIHGKSGREEPTRAANHGQVPPDEGGVKPEQTEAHDGDHDRAKGVLRLLEAGHFKGVADVRLRINFFDELSAGATAATLEALPAKADDLVATLEEQVAALTATFEVDEATSAAISDVLAGFAAEVQGAVEAAGVDGSVDRDALAASVRAAFDGALIELQALFASAEEEPVEAIDPEAAAEEEAASGEEAKSVIDETGNAQTLAVDEGTVVIDEATEAAPVETDVAHEGTVDGSVTAGEGKVVVEDEAPVDEPASLTLEEAFAALAETFDAALADFVASIDSGLQLPDSAPYSGNGAAYDKFLAIYNGLRGLGSASAEEPDHDELA